MGVEYRNETIVGVYAGQTMEDVINFLVSKGVIADYDEYCDAYNEDREELFASIYGGELVCVCENLWSGEGYYFGFEPYSWKDYATLLVEFEQLTGYAGDVHEFVKVF